MQKMRNISGLRAKMLALFLVIALVPLAIFGTITLLEMNSAVSHAEEEMANRSLLISESSKSEFNTTYERELVELTAAKASQYEELFRRIETETEILAEYTAENFSNTGGTTTTGIWIAPFGPDSASIDSKKETINSLSSPAKLLQRTVDREKAATRGYIGTVDGVLFTWPNMDEVLFQIVAQQGTFDHRDRPWYISAADEKKTIWTRPYIDQYTDSSSKLLTITCATPIYRSDMLIGVVGMDISLAAMYADLSSFEIGYPLVIDGEGTIIMGSQGASELEEMLSAGSLVDINNSELNMTLQKMTHGESGSSMISLDEGDFYITYAPIPSVNWTLAIAIPAEDYSIFLNLESEIVESTTQHLKDSAQRLILILILLFSITGLLAGATGLSFGGRIAAPIISLKEAAIRVGRGTFDVKLDSKVPDEIGELSDAFGGMVKDLGQYVTKIERGSLDAGRAQKEEEIVKFIKKSIPSKRIPSLADYEIAALSVPAILGGSDFYYTTEIEDDRIAIVMADVSGEGVSSALLTVLSMALIRASSRIYPDPAIALGETNLLITESSGPGIVACFYGVLDPENHIVEYVNAGHLPPFVVSSEGVVETLVGRGMPLGTLGRIELEAETKEIDSGDIFVLYSDGVTEAINEYGEQFGIERLIALVRKNITLSASGILGAVDKDIKLHTKGTTQQDDSTLIIIKRCG